MWFPSEKEKTLKSRSGKWNIGLKAFHSIYARRKNWNDLKVFEKLSQ